MHPLYPKYHSPTVSIFAPRTWVVECRFICRVRIYPARHVGDPCGRPPLFAASSIPSPLACLSDLWYTQNKQARIRLGQTHPPTPLSLAPSPIVPHQSHPLKHTQLSRKDHPHDLRTHQRPPPAQTRPLPRPLHLHLRLPRPTCPACSLPCSLPNRGLPPL
jgi:hypothetical protein